MDEDMKKWYDEMMTAIEKVHKLNRKFRCAGWSIRRVDRKLWTRVRRFSFVIDEFIRDSEFYDELIRECGEDES